MAAKPHLSSAYMGKLYIQWFSRVDTFVYEEKREICFSPTTNALTSLHPQKLKKAK